MGIEDLPKKYLNARMDCPECGSGSGVCNMWKPEIVEPSQISIAGHCKDCGYSFTVVFDIVEYEILPR